MTDNSKASQPAHPAQSKKDVARERSAAALRENLKRRKAKTRTMKSEAQESKAAPDPRDSSPD